MSSISQSIDGLNAGWIPPETTSRFRAGALAGGRGLIGQDLSRRDAAQRLFTVEAGSLSDHELLERRREYGRVAVEPVPDLAHQDDYTYRTRRDIAGTRAALVRTDAGLRHRQLPERLISATRILLLACGSAIHAARAGRAWLERLSGLPCDIEIASEWSARVPALQPGTVAILLSRGGEDADLLAALRLLQERGVFCLALTTSPASSLAAQADMIWAADAGLQSAPAPTKSVSVKLMALLRLGMSLGTARHSLAGEALQSAELAMAEAPVAVALAEAAEARYAAIACRLALAKGPLLIGRGGSTAVAAHGAELLQQLAQVSAHARAGAELQCGAAALLREGTPVVICAEAGALLAQSVTDAVLARAHGGEVIALIESRAAADFGPVAHEIVALPGRDPATLLSQFVAIQLIAYHTALALGHDVDAPRAGGV